jgi:AcrR family transcriptional regulator
MIPDSSPHVKLDFETCTKGQECAKESFMSEQKVSLNVIAADNPLLRPERRDAAANRALILETADKLFAKQGAENVNMADIAQAAGVGKGTLYRRFANKGELSLALLDTQMVEFQNSMLARMQQMVAQGMSHMEQLDQFLDALVYFTDVHSPLLCVVQQEGLLQGFGNNTRVQLPHFWQHMTISGLLKTAISTGELPPDLDIDYLALKVEDVRLEGR